MQRDAGNVEGLPSVEKVSLNHSNSEGSVIIQKKNYLLIPLIFFICVCVSMNTTGKCYCMWVHLYQGMHTCGGLKLSYRTLRAAMFVLGVEPWSSGKAISGPICVALLSVSWLCLHSLAHSVIEGIPGQGIPKHGVRLSLPNLDSHRPVREDLIFEAKFPVSCLLLLQVRKLTVLLCPYHRRFLST